MTEGESPGFVLSPADVLEFSMQFEERSLIFYDNLSKLMKDEKIRDLFSFLSGEEARHKETFSFMLQRADVLKYDIKSLPGHIEYLHNFLDMSIFSRDTLKLKLNRVTDIESAFEFSMSMELDQVLFYNEISNYLTAEHKKIIEEIIEEERRHFVTIMQVKTRKGY